MQRKPIFSIPQAAAATKLTQPTVWAVINTMKTLRLVRELSEYKHPRLFSYGPYIRLLSEQTMEEEPSEAGPILRTESEPLSATAFAVGDKLR